jgi:hypothetical protein
MEMRKHSSTVPAVWSKKTAASALPFFRFRILSFQAAGCYFFLAGTKRLGILIQKYFPATCHFPSAPSHNPCAFD